MKTCMICSCIYGSWFVSDFSRIQMLYLLVVTCSKCILPIIQVLHYMLTDFRFTITVFYLHYTSRWKNAAMWPNASAMHVMQPTQYDHGVSTLTCYLSSWQFSALSRNTSTQLLLFNADQHSACWGQISCCPAAFPGMKKKRVLVLRATASILCL